MLESRNEMTGRLVAAAPALTAWSTQHGDALEEVLRARWDEARAAWPAIELSLDRWMGALASALDDKSSLLDLRELHAADLYLARACATGDRAALVAFEATCKDAIEGSLRALRIAPDLVSEVAQDVRHKLFVADGGDPKIATYSGRAALTTWLRTVATRAAISQLRKKSDVSADDALLHAIPAASDGPEEQHFRAQYGPELKAAFEEAMASLDVEQRNVLRHHYVDQLTIDEIGALYGVHKTTAFRWLEAARATLSKRTQNAFRARVRLTPSEMQSIVRLLESNVELSLHRVLGI